MEAYMWDERLEYLAKSREFMWNADYFSFLVEKVWKIDRRVDIVDFGCGLGFIGAMLLPLLPPGSTYTGIDKGRKMIAEARRRFGEKGFPVTFIEADILEMTMAPQYDIAICHTVLMHMPDALSVMGTMCSSVKTGGMVVCIELSRNLANAGLYFDGLDHDEMNTLGLLQKLWVNDLKKGKGDVNIGVKLPAYMRQLGLKEVGVRINDCVQFLDPFGDKALQERSRESFMKFGWGALSRDKAAVITSLMERGLTHIEAERMQASESDIINFLEENVEKVCIFSSLFLIIAFGYR